MSSTQASPTVGRRSFRFRVLPAVLTALGLLLLVGLGTWQVERLHWKEDLIARAEAGLAQAPQPLPSPLADPAALDFRHVAARGTYLHDQSFTYGFTAVDGQPGGRLITPLRLEDGRTLLVDRGWIPEALLPPKVPHGLQPAGPVELVGVARDRSRPLRNWLSPTDDVAGHRWFTWDVPAMGQALGLPLLPVVLTLEASEGTAGLPHTEPVRIDLPNDHLGYAITWYGLAVCLLAIYLISSFKEEPEGAPIP